MPAPNEVQQHNIDCLLTAIRLGNPAHVKARMIYGFLEGWCEKAPFAESRRFLAYEAHCRLALWGIDGHMGLIVADTLEDAITALKAKIVDFDHRAALARTECCGAASTGSGEPATGCCLDCEAPICEECSGVFDDEDLLCQSCNNTRIRTLVHGGGR